MRVAHVQPSCRPNNCPPSLPPAFLSGLSATEEVPGSIEARLSPQLAQAAEFTPEELEHIDGEHLVCSTYIYVSFFHALLWMPAL